MASLSAETIMGSSPRGRGIRPLPVEALLGVRLIPAWAGNTHYWLSHSSGSSAHPRVGGEYSTAVTGVGHRSGSSPRGRGIPLRRRADPGRVRLIPAWAGNTLRLSVRGLGGPAHPRVGGEYDDEALLGAADTGSSPRGRGILPALRQQLGQHGLIPAWAGNTAANP